MARAIRCTHCGCVCDKETMEKYSEDDYEHDTDGDCIAALGEKVEERGAELALLRETVRVWAELTKEVARIVVPHTRLAALEAKKEGE